MVMFALYPVLLLLLQQILLVVNHFVANESNFLRTLIVTSLMASSVYPARLPRPSYCPPCATCWNLDLYTALDVDSDRESYRVGYEGPPSEMQLVSKRLVPEITRSAAEGCEVCLLVDQALGHFLRQHKVSPEDADVSIRLRIHGDKILYVILQEDVRALCSIRLSTPTGESRCLLAIAIRRTE